MSDQWRVCGLTISVNYAPELSESLPGWKRFCDRIIVVSDTKDSDTARIVAGVPGCDLHATDCLYAGGASFNKGGALEEARHRLSCDGWVLVFDADILAPSVIPWDQLVHGNLYGATRIDTDGTWIREGGFPGYFWIFHGSDPVLGEQWFTSWKHAGCYDSEFEKKWAREKKIKLPFTVRHIGQRGRNWWGRDNTAAMQRMQSERQRLRSYQHEKVDG